MVVRREDAEYVSEGTGDEELIRESFVVKEGLRGRPVDADDPERGEEGFYRAFQAGIDIAGGLCHPRRHWEGGPPGPRLAPWPASRVLLDSERLATGSTLPVSRASEIGILANQLQLRLRRLDGPRLNSLELHRNQ